MSYPSADTPGLFEHRLDPALFTGDRLDALCQEADRRGTLKVQFADPGRQRYGNDPIYARPSYPILEDAMRRPIQYRIMDVDHFGGAEYKACLDHDLRDRRPGSGARPDPAGDGRARVLARV